MSSSSAPLAHLRGLTLHIPQLGQEAVYLHQVHLRKHGRGRLIHLFVPLILARRHLLRGTRPGDLLSAVR
eukprot:7061498-Pyramimonas_sp.AAC.2